MIKNTAKRLLALVTVLCFLFTALFGLSDSFSSQKGTESKSDEAPSGRFVAAEVFSLLENERGRGVECVLIPLKNTNAQSTERKELVVGGELFGVRMELDGLLITGLGEVETERGAVSPGEEAGLQKGDVLLEANGTPLQSAADLVKIVSR